MKHYFEEGVITGIQSVPKSSNLKIGSTIITENISPDVKELDSNGLVALNLIAILFKGKHVHGKRLRHYKIKYRPIKGWYGSHREPAILCKPVVAYPIVNHNNELKEAA